VQKYRFVLLRRPEGHDMHLASLARLATVIVVLVSLFFSTPCLAATKALEIENMVWERGQLLPAYCEVPLDLGGPVASIQKITLNILGLPKEGSMVICKGGCDTFPCHQTLYAYFSDFRLINAWIPLEGPDTGYNFEIPMQYSDCFPDCINTCESKAAPAETWGFFEDDGAAVLRLELVGDLDGCGASCFAEHGIMRVTVTVEYEPLGGTEVAMWGWMKACYR
jgi:hypothetical protein